ncbi:MAG: hypothetical protein LBR91_02645 [Puniceicoccales bacterium]|jgi:hypothetical protein|nr:hypothetical protein [Puniceicoccales bacterium]
MYKTNNSVVNKDTLVQIGNNSAVSSQDVVISRGDEINTGNSPVKNTASNSRTVMGIKAPTNELRQYHNSASQELKMAVNAHSDTWITELIASFGNMICKSSPRDALASTVNFARTAADLNLTIPGIDTVQMIFKIRDGAGLEIPYGDALYGLSVLYACLDEDGKNMVRTASESIKRNCFPTLFN